MDKRRKVDFDIRDQITNEREVLERIGEAHQRKIEENQKAVELITREGRVLSTPSDVLKINLS